MKRVLINGHEKFLISYKLASGNIYRISCFGKEFGLNYAEEQGGKVLSVVPYLE